MILNQLRDRLFATSHEGLVGLKGRGVRAVRLVYLAAADFVGNRCFQRAAALSFATILSLMPLAVLFFSLASILGGGEKISGFVKEHVFPLMAPDFQQQLAEWIDKYISVNAFGEGAGVLNISAIVGLILAAGSVLVTAERNLNDIWRAVRRRKYLQKLAIFWLILTISPLMIVASMSVGDWLVPAGGWLDSFVADHWWAGALYQVIVPLFVGFVGFSVLYALLPCVKVPLLSAALGGLAAALLWELSKRVFYLYVGHLADVTSFYSGLASVPLFMIWVFINWVITLFGAEVGYVHHNLRPLSDRTARTGRRRLQDVELAFTLLRRCTDAWNRGDQGADAVAVAREMSCSSEEMLHVADVLVGQGALVEDARSPGSFRLARDVDQINLTEVVGGLAQPQAPEADAED